MRSLMAYETKTSIFALSNVPNAPVVSAHFLSKRGLSVSSTDESEFLRLASVSDGLFSSDMIYDCYANASCIGFSYS